MGVYIKGMEMSKSCGNCYMFSFLSDSCRITNHVTEEMNDKMFDRRFDDCPLTEVPEPHGDLIDASEKIRVQMYDDDHEDFHTVEMTIDDLLSQSWVKAYAFPVIPASESKERPAFLPQYELTPRSEEG